MARRPLEISNQKSLSVSRENDGAPGDLNFLRTARSAACCRRATEHLHWKGVLRQSVEFTLQSTVFVFAFSFAPVLLGGWPAGVYGTGLSMALMRVPQIVELARQRHADGVSAPAWYAGVVCSVLWLFYYAGAHTWAAFWSTMSAGVASLVVALLATLRHRQALADRALAGGATLSVEQTA